MTDVLTDFFKAIGETHAFLNQVHPLAAIWLPVSIITQEGRKVRLCAGLHIKVEDGSIVDCLGDPSHEILECFGANQHSFPIIAKNIESGKKETIYLPNF